MLKVIHRFQKTIIVYIVVLILVLSMMVFGVDSMSPRQNSYAVKVGETELSFEDFSAQRQQLEQQYRARFGALLYQLVEQGNLNLNQETVDRVIPAMILKREAQEEGFVVSKKAIADFLKKNFSYETYRAYLENRGISAAAFEKNVADDLLSEQLVATFKDLSQASSQELKSYVFQEKTQRDLEYVLFDPADYEAKVGEVSTEEQEEYFASHTADFEIPEQLSYNFLVINPQDVEAKVEVLPEDIELYYSEHESEFSLPAKFKVQQVYVSVKPDAKEDERNAAKSEAEEVLGKAMAGEDFTTLAKQYSDDVNTNLTGGDLGWITKGDLDEKLEAALLKLNGLGISELIESDNGFYVLKVNEYQEASSKPLDEVKEGIVAAIRKREAPAYITVVAQELFDRWEKSDKSLKDEFASESYEIGSAEKLTSAQDSRPVLSGLTSYLIATPEVKKQIVERPESMVIAEIIDYQEAQVPELASVSDKIISEIKKTKAIELAKSDAELFKTALLEKSFEQAANDLAKKVQSAKDVSKGSNLPPDITAQEARDYIYNTWSKDSSASSVIKQDGKFLVVRVIEIKHPEIKEQEQEEMQTALNSELEEVLFKAFVNSRKASLEVDVNPSIL